MTDTTEPWSPPPPLPATGPASAPDMPLPGAEEPPRTAPAPQPESGYQAESMTPVLDVSPSSDVPQPTQVAIGLPASTLPRPGRRGLVVIVVLIILGLAGVLGGAAALARELTRTATKTEQAAALAAEIASRWQRLPAGEIFPAMLSYENSDGAAMTMTRVGIAARSSCRIGLEPSAYRQLRQFGCAAILRATYVDAGGARVVTVGIAAFPSGQAALQAQGALEASDTGRGLDALAFDGTVAGRFSNAQRGASGAQFAGPYVLLYTAGYTDAMPGSIAAANNQLVVMGDGVLGALEPTLTRHTSACTMKDIKC
jgi:hypothetical protein